ncbi:MAG: heme o synthase [Terriglobales bacterium]
MSTLQAISPPESCKAFTAKLRDYYTLTKPEVNLLILMTTSAGYVLGSTGSVRIAGLINTIMGTLLVASGTATLNQFMERVYDGRMRRTSNRPLPAGRLEAREAFWFGILLSIAGGLYLLLTVNALSSLLAVSTLLSYLLVYTPLKRKTHLCTLLGAIPGGMPILIGWTGASGRLNLQAAMLFGVLFLWQFPHFLAIAMMYREDYERAGYKMLPASDPAARFTRAEIVGFTIALIALTATCTSVTGGGVGYLIGIIALGAFLLYHSVRLAIYGSRPAASRLLHASVIYLPAVLVIMVASKK